MNKDLINRALRINIEIEGALRVLAADDCEASKAALAETLLNEKMQTLTQIIEMAALTSKPEPTAPVPEEKPKRVADDEPLEETLIEKMDDVFTDAIPEDLFVKEVTGPVPNEVDEKILLIEEEEKEEEIKDYDKVTAPEKLAAPEFTPNPTPQYTDETEGPTTLSDMLNPKDTRLEDVLAKKETKKLASAFTLNDKFRFIRGIFCDDREDFDYTVARLSECDSLAEVYDYLLNDQGWDIDNEEVKDFISIIANYFNS